MTEISDDMLVNLPTEDGADDVEAHGMREVAVGLGVAAAVIGSGGTANAVDTPTIGGSTQTITSAVHDTLEDRNHSTRTTRALSHQLEKRVSQPANEAAADADGVTTETTKTARDAVEEVLAQVDAAKADAEDKAVEVKAEADARLTSTHKFVEDHAKAVHDALMTTKDDVDRAAAEMTLALQADLQAIEKAVKEDANDLIGKISDLANGTLNKILGVVNDTKTAVMELHDDAMRELGDKKEFVEDTAETQKKFVTDKATDTKRFADDTIAEKLAFAMQTAAEKQQFATDTAAEKQKFATDTAAEKQKFATDTAAEKQEFATDTATWAGEEADTQLGNAKSAVNKQVGDGVTLVKGAATGAQQIKDDTVRDGSTTVRDTGSALQQDANQAVGTVTSAPSAGTAIVVGTIETVEQQWTEATDDVQAPVEQISNDAADAAEGIGGTVPDPGPTLNDLDQPSL